MTSDRNTTRWERGDRARRDVLGDHYVDAARVSEFAAPLQELLTEYCWGGPWSRDGLSRRTRSLLNLAILGSLNRPRELAIHTKGALRNGCSEAEIAEVLLQMTVYAGVAAGVDAFHVAEAAIRDYRAEQDTPEASTAGTKPE